MTEGQTQKRKGERFATSTLGIPIFFSTKAELAVLFTGFRAITLCIFPSVIRGRFPHLFLNY